MKHGLTISEFTEDGHYYVKDSQGRTRIVEVERGRIYDGRQLLADLCRYEVLGPGPMPEELESLTTACCDAFNPCGEMTP